MKTTYVYFIKERLGIHAPVKIGVAKNPEGRMAELQIGNSRRLEIVARLGPMSAKHAYGTETRLHSKFKKYRIRGEWFSGVILRYMNTIIEDIAA